MASTHQQQQQLQQGSFQVIIPPGVGTATVIHPNVNANVNVSSNGSTGCLLCLVNITPTTSPTNIAQHHNDAFDKLCSVLKVNLSPFSWNFAVEPFPFCPKCASTMFTLYDYYEKVKEIEKRIDATISQIKSNIKTSETTRTVMPLDVRAVIFRGQVLKDFEGRHQEGGGSNQILAQVHILNHESQSPKIVAKTTANKTISVASGLVYNPSKTSNVQRGPQTTNNNVTPVATNRPALVAVSSLETNYVSSPVKETHSHSISSLISQSMNVIDGHSQHHEGAEVDLKQLLGTVEVYPTTGNCSPNKSTREITNLNYLTANETVVIQGTDSSRQPETISVDVAPEQVNYDNDFDSYHDDSQNDPDYSVSEDDEDNQEIKKAVNTIIEQDKDDSDYVPKSCRGRKRKSSKVLDKSKRKRPEEYNVAVKTEPIDSDGEISRTNGKRKSTERKKTTKPKSEPKKYVSLIQTDSLGRMFYEGIPVQTCEGDDKAVSCGECGKVCSNNSLLSGNKKSLILHMRTHHLQEWHDGVKLVKRKRAPPVSYVSMLQTDEHGRVFFKGHEVIGTKDSPEYSCGTCGKSYGGHTAAHEKRALVIRHIQGEHVGETFDCDQCDASYKQKGSLYDHKLKIHVHGEIECDVCGKKCLRKYYKNHRFSHLNQEEKAAAFASGTAPPAIVRRNTSCICNVCGLAVRGVDNLKKHEKSHTAELIDCTLCGRQVKSSSMGCHMRHVHKKRKRTGNRCPQCLKVVKDLDVHMKAHLALSSEIKHDSKFECSICGKKSASEEKNKIHETTKHIHGATRFKENYTYGCDFCSSRYLSKKSARDHRNRVHRAEVGALKGLTLPSRSAKLDPISGELVDYSQMGRHLNIDKSEGATAEIETSETGELSFLTVQIMEVNDGYECGMCNAVTTGDSADDKIRIIKQHIRAHHLGEFQCGTCRKFWDSQSSLNQHERNSHSIIPCTVCQRPTPERNLQLHLWTHKSQEEKQAVIDAGNFSEVPPSVKRELGIPLAHFEVDCNICGITAPTKGQLEKHQRAEHPETRPFWNRNKRKIKGNKVNNAKSTKKQRKQETDNEEEDDDSFSLTETDSSDTEHVTPRKRNSRSQKPEPSHISKRTSQTRRSTNTRTSPSPSPSTSQTDTTLQPYISVSRLPPVISTAKKCTVVDDNSLFCLFSDGEMHEVSILETSEVQLQSYFEIADDFSNDDDSRSASSSVGSVEDFAVIPNPDNAEGSE